MRHGDGGRKKGDGVGGGSVGSDVEVIVPAQQTPPPGSASNALTLLMIAESCSRVNLGTSSTEKA